MKSIRNILSLALFGTVLSVGAVEAQNTDRREIERRLRELREEMRDLERQLGRSGNVDAWAISGLPRVLQLSQSRAQLGVYVQQEADEESDAVGALLSGVVAGGPADEAGLEEGDIIISFDGEQLAGRYPAARRGESEPGKKMVDLVADMEPGDEVEITYRRGSETRTTTATLDERGSLLFGGSNLEHIVAPRIAEVGPLSPRVEVRSVGPEGNIFTIFQGGVWADMELVALNEELGSYFGTDEGLLVIQAPDYEDMDLQGGDVILSINGREARTPTRALRILQSYEEGESAQIEIMRERRRMTVTITVPERTSWEEDGWGGRWQWQR